MKTKEGFTLLEMLIVLAIISLLAVMMSGVFTQNDDQERFVETRKRMEEIRRSIIGESGSYINGQRQFTGYASDMGSLPGLDGDGQPVGLWNRDTDGDGSPDLSEWEFQRAEPDNVFDGGNNYICIRSHTADGVNKPADDGGLTPWKGNEYWIEVSVNSVNPWNSGKAYYSGTKLWIGWRGPYLDTPYGGVLNDGWGNPFLFTCEAESFNITSLGNDNEVGGSEFSEDITLTIKTHEYTGALAGRVVDADSNTRVFIHFPYKGEDAYCRKALGTDGYFRFEKGAVIGGSNPSGLDKDIPVGNVKLFIWNDSDDSKTINSGDKTGDALFNIEPTGNWLGDMEIP